MQPRILFLDQSGALGGAELYLLDVARHYREASRVVLFEKGPFYDRLLSEGICAGTVAAPEALLNVKKQGHRLQGVKALPGVVQLVGRIARMSRPYDLLYANSQKAFIVGALAGLVARRPVIWNLHDILTADHFSALNRRLAVWCANYLADRVIVNSQATRRAFAASGGQVGKTAIVYNGIAPGPFASASASEAKQLRKEIDISRNAPVVGVFSRLAPWKGQHVLLRALAKLPGVHALLVGGALFGGDDQYERELRGLVERLELRERVHVLGFRDDVPRLMQAVDVVAHTSVAPEPFGRVIVEGMLARRPVVAARAGGAREIIDAGTTGLLVTPGDPSALADAIRELLADPPRAEALARAGHRAARARFSVEAMLENLDRQIEAVAQARSSGPPGN